KYDIEEVEIKNMMLTLPQRLNLMRYRIFLMKSYLRDFKKFLKHKTKELSSESMVTRVHIEEEAQRKD
ncbi:hypothetical protein Lal_00000983, partial [Lupinus albus]